MKNRLIQLLANNEHKAAIKPSIKNADGDVASIYIYTAIGGWYGVEAEVFVKEINEITAPTVNLYINSGGGDVFEARAISAAIKRHKSTFNAYIDALAASAATGITTACDKVYITEGGFYMIHNAWTLSMGNAKEMRNTAKLLDQVDSSIIGDYIKQTDNSEQEIRDWMEAETWFSAEDAVKYGFCDGISESIEEDETVENTTKQKWNLSAYDNAPKALTEQSKPKEELEEPLVFDHDLHERRLKMLAVVAA